MFAALASAALVAMLFVGAASASASPAGVLRASFEGYFSGGNGAVYATWDRNGKAWFHAASTGSDWEEFGIDGAARIGLWGTEEEPQLHCSDNLFGIWVRWTDTDKAALEGLSVRLWFGPADGTLAPLQIERTPVKRVVNPQGWSSGPGTFWWLSAGVPVYGHLAAGNYRYHVEDTYLGVPEALDFYVTILDC
jgi:hypothetical protein